MLLKQYGHAAIHIDGEQFTVTPSFANFSSLGEPKEIVDLIKQLHFSHNIPLSFQAALKILNACCDKVLPSSFTGSVKVGLDGKVKLSFGKYGAEAVNDVIVLAGHCIKHGVTGAQVSEGSAEGDTITEFDASEYIDLAATHFKISYDEAAKMTMTQFVRRMRTEYPEAHKRVAEVKANEQEQIAMVEYLRERGII